MTPLLQLVAYTTVLTWVSIMAAAALRNREWTREGMKVGLSNHDHLPEATPLGGRAVRAATNTLENFVLFTALALTAHAAGRDAEATLGAQVFFWSRIVYRVSPRPVTSRPDKPHLPTRSRGDPSSPRLPAAPASPSG